MNFFDTVTEMGYSVDMSLKEIIEITKKDDTAEIHILFYMNEKKIMGYVRQLKDFYDINDVTHFYNSFFLPMQRDLKALAERSKYTIV